MKRRNQHKGVENERRLGGIGGLIAAPSLGAGFALLLAPRSGEEVRHALRRRYQKTMRRVERSTGDLRDRLENLLDQANDVRHSKLRRFLSRR